MTQQGWAPLPAPPAQPPPPYFAPPPAPAKPSGGFKALAIVQMVLGAGGVLYSLFTLVATSVLFLRTGMRSLYSSGQLVVTYGGTGMNVVTGIMLIATGIGIWKAKRWSRTAGIAYAVTSLTETLVVTAVNVLVVMPAATGRTHVAAAGHGFEAILIVTALLGALVVAILPAVTLFVLLSTRAKSELDQ